jgi:ribosomal protein S27AE
MNHKKPTPVLGQLNRKICPVCGQRSYSASGIHPQCAVRQADASREQLLQAHRKAAAAEKKPIERKPPQTWSRKQCPQCGTQVHARRKSCDCGFEFPTT